MALDDQPPSIPIVDFGQYLHGSEQAKKAAAAAIDSAFQKVGFVYLTNHAVPQEEVDKCFEWVSIYRSPSIF
jgi:isopenicillin N synthase-like dioxygenase